MCCLVALGAAQARADAVLLFAYFTGNGESGLHFARSEDGLAWRPVAGGRVFMAPEVGEKERLVRDPCVVRGPDGVYHLVWTPGWGERGIGYAHSTDLVRWSKQRYLPVMEAHPGARNCWAPELFHDAAAGRWMIFWASTLPSMEAATPGPEGTWNHRMYHTTTVDFAGFAPAARLYDHGFSVIDSTIARDGDGYVMVLKDETPDPPQKNLRVARAPGPTGPWGPPSAPITGDYWAEGPTLLHRDGRWWVYFDRYREGRFGLVVSADLKTWEDWSDRVALPPGARHGTVFTAPRTVADAMETAGGGGR
jgi:beta-xylosidase